MRESSCKGYAENRGKPAMLLFRGKPENRASRTPIGWLASARRGRMAGYLNRDELILRLSINSDQFIEFA